MHKIKFISITLLVPFYFLSAQPVLFGTTSNSGSNSEAIVFKYTTKNNSLSSFRNENFANGVFTNQGLLQATDGNLYGMAKFGGKHNMGTIFSISPDAGEYKVVHNFDTATGGVQPQGTLVEGVNKKLYGMTPFGGKLGYGVIFSFDLKTNTYTVLHNFDKANGGMPQGTLTVGKSGELYGITYYGGMVQDNGVLFSFNPSNNLYKKLHDFNGIDGAHPANTITLGKGTKLYGQTEFGGNASEGVIFEFDTQSSVYKKLYDFTTQNGGSPASLVFASDGKLYGVNSGDNKGSKGSIFSFDPTNSLYSKLHGFSGSDGAIPVGTLLEASDGKLYGTTMQGGKSDMGVLFALDLQDNNFKKLQDFTGENGSVPFVGSLIELKCLFKGTDLGGCPETIDDINNLEVSVLPNPSNSYFTLNIKAKKDDRVTLKVIDTNGRILDTKMLGKTSNVYIGQRLGPGIYYAEVEQAGKKVIVKLLKQ